MIPLMRAVIIPALVLLSVASASAEQVQVYELPQGARPHDVAPAPDGKVWYTAQRNGKLGILDPQTWVAREIPLGPKSSPHGVIQGPDGAAWITDSGQNAIVRFDPKTEEIKVWKLPEDAGYANLNTAAFDKDGVHWFTGQNGIYGRLDPKTGDIKVFKAPKGRGPYGIASTPDGEVYYVSLAGSFLGKVDRARRNQGHRTTDAQPGCSPRVVGFSGSLVGLGMELRSAFHARSERQQLEGLARPGDESEGLRRLCR
jgi:virginiamycin B lyase